MTRNKAVEGASTKPETERLWIIDFFRLKRAVSDSRGLRATFALTAVPCCVEVGALFIDFSWTRSRQAEIHYFAAVPTAAGSDAS